MRTTLPYAAASKSQKLDPWILSRLIARTLLQAYPKTLARVEGLLRSRNLKELTDLCDLKSLEYQDPSKVTEGLALRQISALFKKNAAFSDDTLCSKQAEANFKLGEKRCRITNRRLDYYWFREDRIKPELRRQIVKMRRDIASLLGEAQVMVSEIPKLIKVTNGATEDRPRRRSYPYLKITGKIRAPKAAVPLVGEALISMGVDLATCKYTCVEHNVVCLVPKNWKTHRTIAKEPTHSMPLQLAINSFIVKKLRKWGIDLSSQQRNQDLAREGSLTGELSTIDLEMASDTNAFNTVGFLLPDDWFALLKSVRSSRYKAPWGNGVYEKFSSMGNGYTFSLETLIFGAACRAVGSTRYAVYGDDIVIETDLAEKLIRLLSFLGFKTNSEKTFTERHIPFRESCGGDYIAGRRVTPFYLREVPFLHEKATLSHIVNGLVLVSYPGPLWDYLKEMVHKWKLRIVPFSEDTRAGVFVSGDAARRRGLIRYDRRQPTERWANPLFGHLTFKGYGQKQVTRNTRGQRSLFLWYLQKVVESDARPNFLSDRTGTLLLQKRAAGEENLPGVTITSVVTERSRYVHKTLRYVHHSVTPDILILWDEFLLGRENRA